MKENNNLKMADSEKDSDDSADFVKQSGIYHENLNKMKKSFKDFDDIPLEIEVRLGQSTLTIRQLLELSHGSIVSIDKSAGEPMDIFLNSEYLGKGEISVVEDSFNVRIIRISDSGNDNAKV
ncbi:MAG: hypothetical protein A2161_04355 [Candidatus Schekmanbacteria bacterium RBG_13_48_7]|uniref:Flagellar motor switch protein FliN-like C-terminal domain-containing protein n=1 Tax=Candidatus Schekmanbacteria bacterium RBG_13_48_7 TaxID=1817878 RepID=A0A1F7RTI8_9BACT|nr:MAG: hypothetical protein A2161_04355 [Candidatus Schekmanbacteria bacterium RBG_13_48_7]